MACFSMHGSQLRCAGLLPPVLTERLWHVSVCARVRVRACGL